MGLVVLRRGYRDYWRHEAPLQDPFDTPPADLVKKALAKLSAAGIELIAWGSLLQRSLHVPVVAKHFTFLVPDEQLDKASDIVAKLNLPLSPPHDLLVKSSGDFYSKGRLHRLTRSTTLESVQYLHLFPASFPAYLSSELVKDTSQSPDYTLLVPRASAVYASILRLLASHPRKNPRIRNRLLSDLEMLIHYNLMDLQGGFVDSDDDEQWDTLQMDSRIETAVATVQAWGLNGEWREGEDWMQDALIAVIKGTASMDNLPWFGS
ncbi:hypothetical protein CPB84DRAFT_1815254 [Gymnopilus junonius]|uniref:Uncharacterized protein n=1 Tax=Gymnopilus junonius TaxID=109634 RepID=A0A9P5NNG4_GYMJU|nr:hypothetical protein CPB84DRAFT_1815254 [Gymnopilus junonius]